MHARAARFEGLDPARIDEMVDGIKAQIESGERPPGLEDAKGLWLLVDRARGVNLSIVLFDSEEGLRRGDEALNAMSPPGGDGNRTRVEIFEVALRRELG
jgi:hypothetical protein